MTKEVTNLTEGIKMTNPYFEQYKPAEKIRAEILQAIANKDYYGVLYQLPQPEQIFAQGWNPFLPVKGLSLLGFAVETGAFNIASLLARREKELHEASEEVTNPTEGN